MASLRHGGGRRSWRSGQESPPAVDVCLIAEGCYPFVAGGVSSWIDWLMRTLPHLQFCVVAIVTGKEANLRPRYDFPENLHHFEVVTLDQWGAVPWRWMKDRHRACLDELGDALATLARHGGLREFRTINRIVGRSNNRVPPAAIMHSRLNWNLVCHAYETVMPHASFLDFYWAWRALFGGMFSILHAPLPPARVYHTVSTGYAGLYAARATIETGRPAVVTEHGIYTNERRVEVQMADWIADTVQKGFAINDDRSDLRDVWVRVFDAYARICYDACDVVTALYDENSQVQGRLGAPVEKLRIIANGIRVEQFEDLPVAGADARPTMAFIGRVVPIKDVKSFIVAAAQVKRTLPDVHAVIMGPTDEEPAYYEECRALVAAMGLEQTVTFTGRVDIRTWLPRLHAVVLTSLSEAQPLVLLEAGAAGIPCVATNAGSCREILYGHSDEFPALGPGGAITGLVAPDEIAQAVVRLLLDHDLRRQQGEALRRRVRTYYRSQDAAGRYDELYRELAARPSRSCDLEVA